MTVRTKPGPVLGVLLTGIVAIALALAAVAPVRAQSTTTTSTEAPPPAECESVSTSEDLAIQYCRPTDRTSASPSFPLRIEVTNTRIGPDPQVREISATIVATTRDQQVPDPANQTWTGGARTATLAWEPTFTTNGAYDLVITARGDRIGGQESTKAVPMLLAAPPHAPTGVKIAKVDDGSLLISWSSNREPDVLFYDVRRAPQGDSTSKLVDTVDAGQPLRVVDDPGVGSWRYSVVAVRRGAADDAPVASKSSSAAVDVASATTTGGAQGSSSSSGGTTTGASSSSGSTAGSTTTAGPAVSPGSRPGVALGTITTAGGRTVTTARRPPEPDPGFDETLPFDVPAGPPATVAEEEPLELGADDDQAAGQDLIADGAGERRRSLGFVAGGLLLFVLGMTGLFLKAEVRRVDALESLDPPPVGDDAITTAAAPTPASTAPTPVVAAVPDAVPAPVPAAVPAVAPEVADVPVATDAGLAVPALAAVAPAAAGTRSRIPRRVRRAASGAEARTLPEPGEAAAFAAPVEPAAAEPIAPAAAVDEPPVAAAPAERPDPAAAAPVAGAFAARRASRAAARAQRADELATMFGADATDAEADDRHLAELTRALRPAAAPARPIDRRVRRTVAPIDAPDLDVPDPIVPVATVTSPRPSPKTSRTRTTDRARRAPTRLPSRPADDRREGGAAVRARRRGTGQGDRRLPVG